MHACDSGHKLADILSCTVDASTGRLYNHTPHMCQKCLLFPVGLTHLVVLDQPLVPCDPVVPQAMAPGLVLTACNLDLVLLLEDGSIHEDGGVQKHRECLTLKVLADEGEGDIDSAVRQAHALIKHNLDEEEGWCDRVTSHVLMHRIQCSHTQDPGNRPIHSEAIGALLWP